MPREEGLFLPADMVRRLLELESGDPRIPRKLLEDALRPPNPSASLAFLTWGSGSGRVAAVVQQGGEGFVLENLDGMELLRSLTAALRPLRDRPRPRETESTLPSGA